MSFNKKVSLVHIGLMKTATTTMQNLWLKDSKSCLVHAGLLQIVQKARMTGKNPNAGAAVPLQWQYDTKPGPDQHVVMSQEALSTAYINERVSKSAIKSFQKAAAKNISMIAPGAKILITVRQPEKWILSIYNQSVKMGGTDTFPEFLKQEKEFLKQSLNLLDLFEIWGKSFGKNNILILPIELLRKSREDFFHEITKFSGIPEPDLNINIEANPSMKPEHLRLMKKFNEWVDIFKAFGVHGPNLPQQTAQALNIIRFAVRYSLESPSPELEEKVVDIESRLPDCEMDPALIDRDFLSRINGFFAKVLKADDFFGYRKLYVHE